jgi:hypothetical protein
MKKDQWGKFTKRIPIKAGNTQIYQSWATQEGLEKWFLRKAEFVTIENKLRHRQAQVEKGDSYKWHWHGYPDSVYEHRKVLEANGNDFFQFSFTADCIVSVNIKSEQGETIVELTQENIPPDNDPNTNLYVGCGEGWTFYLANLKSILEGGIDLRNKNNDISKVINS